MTLKVAGCEGEKGSYEDPKSRYEHYVESYCQKHSECVWAKIIDLYRTGVNSECLLEACLPSSWINNECVMHDAKRGGRRVSVTMTLIFFKIVWMCPLSENTLVYTFLAGSSNSDLGLSR